MALINLKSAEFIVYCFVRGDISVFKQWMSYFGAKVFECSQSAEIFIS